MHQIQSIVVVGVPAAERGVAQGYLDNKIQTSLSQRDSSIRNRFTTTAAENVETDAIVGRYDKSLTCSSHFHPGPPGGN